MLVCLFACVLVCLCACVIVVTSRYFSLPGYGYLWCLCACVLVLVALVVSDGFSYLCACVLVCCFWLLRCSRYLVTSVYRMWLVCVRDLCLHLFVHGDFDFCLQGCVYIVPWLVCGLCLQLNEQAVVFVLGNSPFV